MESFLSSKQAMLLALAAVFSGCHPDTFVEGENGVWSPEGSQIAFQRHNGRDYDIGVLEISTGSIRWVSADSGEAVFPAWTRDGGLLFTYCAITQTAYRAMRTGNSNGFNIWHCGKDGFVRQLTSGRHFDSTCTMAPDGSLWFSSTRQCKETGQSHLWRALSLDEEAIEKARPLNESISAFNRGVNSPAVSPDGRLVAWAELRDFWDAWTIQLARTNDLAQPVRLLPVGMVGYSPTWHPDGRHILFTGFRDGDKGWQVYIINAETGALKKLAPGRNPSVAPDGKRYLFDDTRLIHLRELSAQDFPLRVPPDPGYAERPEKVLFRLERPNIGAAGKMPPAVDFGDDEVWFARAVVDWDGDASKYQRIFCGGWKTSGLGCQLYFANGTPHFATREARDKLFSVSSGKIYPHDKPIVLTGIRTPTAIYVSVNDGPPIARAATMGLIPTREPAGWHVGYQANATTAFRSIELGSGWPKNVPPAQTGKDLFR